MDMVALHRFDVHLVTLDPTVGAEIRKTRPCVIVSPNEVNDMLNTVVVAPMTTTVRTYPTRVRVRFQGKAGEIAVDQLRAPDRDRLVKRLGSISQDTRQRLQTVLLECFG